jgi:dienelactone hydrolase
MTIVPRLVLAIASLLLAWQDVRPTIAAERVHFESARYQASAFQLRRARARGESLARAAADTIDGYLTKPEGNGPFAAVVHLHGCGGLPRDVKTGAGKHLWSAQLAAWGYVVLVVDSFTTRGIDNTCAGEPAPRAADAIGALAYLARQPFVDAGRIAVIGFSAGGIATLSLAEARDFELFENEAAQRFKAAVAFYPACAGGDRMKMPTLILIGELDDWSRPGGCRAMLAWQAKGSPLQLIVYPGAYHVFDAPAPARRYFGHWLEYNAAAAEQAMEEVKRFLAEQLAR